MTSALDIPPSPDAARAERYRREAEHLGKRAREETRLSEVFLAPILRVVARTTTRSDALLTLSDYLREQAEEYELALSAQRAADCRRLAGMLADLAPGRAD